MGNWGVSWDMRYFGSYLDQCFNTDPAQHCNMPNYASKNWGYGTGADRIGVEVLNDVQGRYALPWNATIALGVRNLFNRTPPLTFNVTNNNGAYYDPTVDLTRYIYLQYNQKF
jgi:iron complex outermembrane receptor protein